MTYLPYHSKYAGTDTSAARKSKLSLAPREFAMLLHDCQLYHKIGAAHVGWYALSRAFLQKYRAFGGKYRLFGREYRALLRKYTVLSASCCTTAYFTTQMAPRLSGFFFRRAVKVKVLSACPMTPSRHDVLCWSLLQNDRALLRKVRSFWLCCCTTSVSTRELGL